MMLEISEIGEFYKDKCLFMTGGSGFIGKVLIAKLLTSCPGIGKIYILLRGKRGLSPDQRLKQLLDSKIFEALKSSNPEALRKVEPIEGDISMDRLGIAENQIKILQDDVAVVIHAAATVKFNAPLREAVNLNILGTRRIIQLAKSCPKIESFVHISTAYANCHLQSIQEIVYKPRMTPQQLIDMVDWMTDETLEEILPKILEKRPNTYTITKALAETLVIEESGDLPIAILRPSVVSAALKDPYPGWIDNTYNAAGIVHGVMKGVLRAIQCDRNNTFDLIPVDIVVNMILATAWATSKQSNIARGTTIPVYHCTSGQLNPVKYDVFLKETMSAIKIYPDRQAIRAPSFTLCQSSTNKHLIQLFDQYLPSFFMDGALLLQGKKALMVKSCSRVNKMVESVEYFAQREWDFSTENLVQLEASLNSIDRKIFGFDVKKIEWPSYLENLVLGVRKFVLKEDVSSLSTARNMIHKKLVFERSIQALLWLTGASLIFKQLS